MMLPDLNSLAMMIHVVDINIDNLKNSTRTRIVTIT